MKKDKFLLLLNNNASLTVEETAQLGSVLDEFPYSQAIHNLVARGEQLNNTADRQKRLNLAAVYATDRSLLKALVTSPRSERMIATSTLEVAMSEDLVNTTAKEVKPATEITPTKIAEKEEIKISNVAQPGISSKKDFQPSALSGDDLLDELLHDLDRLKVLKHNFESAAEAFDKLPPLKAEKEVERHQEPTKPTKVVASAPEGIIAEIKNTKKKIKPSDPKQKEQLEIIDNFIKSKPSIGKKSTSTIVTDNSDLSENSSVFSENIVSETLVEILIKQGKKDKAVEVLKKLIWKFPQKKAYFAAQIEELKS